MLSATATGSTTITATIDGVSGLTTVTVVASVAYVVVSPAITTISSNQTRQLTASARLTDGSQLNVSGLVKWGTLLGCGGTTISPTGLVTGGRLGISIFTATLGRATGYATVIALPRSLW